MISSHSLREYESARERLALRRRGDLGRIVVSGTDRAAYLHGLLTNDVASLKGGQGCYAAYLTPQGRMITDLWVYELGDIILLVLPLAVKNAVLAKLDQFIFSEDVQLGDVTDTFGHLAVVGPAARNTLGAVFGLTLDIDADRLGLPEHGNVRLQVDDQPVIVLRDSDLGEPGYDLVAARAVLDTLQARLMAAGASELDDEAAEALRIESGVPRFHVDMDEGTIPLEAGIESRAISLTKGCYVGQEVIIRVLHRGHGRVARKLVGLTFEGAALPSVDDPLTADGKDVGRVTSRSWSPALGQGIGLGYVHRDFTTPGTILGVGNIAVHVTAVPFVRSADAEVA